MRLPDPDDEDGHDCAAYAFHLPDGRRRCLRCGDMWTVDLPESGSVKFGREKVTRRHPVTGKPVNVKRTRARRIQPRRDQT